MKYAVWIGLFAAGLTIGYIVGNTTYVPTEEPQVSTTEFIKETVHDTIIQTETIEIPVDEEEIDSAEMNIDTSETFIDSLIVVENNDTLEDEISISTEKMVAYKWVSVNVLKENQESDSLIKDMLEIEENMPTRLRVEFWESPLNFRGYKLSRSKLVLYGMPSQLDYKVYRKQKDYFLFAQSFYYSLKETEEFLPYLEVSKEEVFND